MCLAAHCSIMANGYHKVELPADLVPVPEGVHKGLSWFCHVTAMVSQFASHFCQPTSLPFRLCAGRFSTLKQNSNIRYIYDLEGHQVLYGETLLEKTCSVSDK